MKPKSNLRSVAWCVGGVVAVGLLVVFQLLPARRAAKQAARFEQRCRLAEAAHSCALEYNLTSTNLIEISKVKDFLKGPVIPVCPDSKLAFGPSKLFEGPFCPGRHGYGTDVLAAALLDKNHPCRALALRVIGPRSRAGWLDRPSNELIEGLILVVQEEQGEPRALAVASLGYITRQKFGKSAAAWREWWRENKESFWQRPPR